MRRQAMEHDRILASARDQFLVDPVAGKVLETTLALVVLSHRRPDVRVKNIGAGNGCTRILDELDRVTLGPSELDRLVGRAVTRWGWSDEVHAQLRARDPQR